MRNIVLEFTLKTQAKVTAEMVCKKMLCYVLVATITCVSVSCKSAIPDAQLRSTISDHLLAAAGMAFVTVSVDKGIATLTGTVSSDSDKVRAESLARIEGIKSIDNRITVVTPTPDVSYERSEVHDRNEAEVEQPSFESEAYELAQKFVDKTVTKCGGSYFFGTNAGTVYECKNEPSISIEGTASEPKELSKADKLNGADPLPVEWDGHAKIELGVCRQYNKGNGWSQWHDYPEKLILHVRKAKGHWSQDQEQGKLQAPSYNVAIPCAQVNAINKSGN